MTELEIELLNKEEIYRHTFFIIGEILVSQSKLEITDKQALEQIRSALRKCNSAFNDEPSQEVLTKFELFKDKKGLV